MSKHCRVIERPEDSSLSGDGGARGVAVTGVTRLWGGGLTALRLSVESLRGQKRCSGKRRSNESDLLPPESLRRK